VDRHGVTGGICQTAEERMQLQVFQNWCQCIYDGQGSHLCILHLVNGRMDRSYILSNRLSRRQRGSYITHNRNQVLGYARSDPGGVGMS
jgi:hypothetical protein